ncbi:MAG: diaminobutyrate--2-oxoglutarate transaminase [Methanosarcinales archaeon]|nr:diaminobutyrate--2-oxoglutarate transaminase [Methanosarcinales archaeon]
MKGNNTTGGVEEVGTYGGFRFRHPTVEDGDTIWRLVKHSPPLDLNSRYSYLILCKHFRETCVIGENDKGIVSFLSTYKPPERSDVLFIWQVAVARHQQGKGVASAMVKYLLSEEYLKEVTYLETSVTPPNRKSLALFKSIAGYLDTTIEKQEFLKGEDFGANEHPPEILLRIGPFTHAPEEVSDEGSAGLKVFKEKESEVRSYSRAFPTVFDHAHGSIIYDESNNRYIDFFAGAGTLNYGHNNPLVTEALIEYLQNDGIVHGLDKATTSKRRFIESFYSIILEPRDLDYKIQFPGPTGTNAVETALKLARMIKGTSNIIAFTNAFHGLTMGSLSITGNDFYRDESFISRNNVAFMPYDGYFGDSINTVDYLRKFLEDSSSGLDDPAAVIVETVQGEGGVNVSSIEWLRQLSELCHEFDILLIVDDIQVGNGRTGPFFSFEHAGITPDIVTLSKSIGGGLPLSLVLMKPELDIWKPGEHTGTFRGNNLAFVAATQLFNYWKTDELTREINKKSSIVRKRLETIRDRYPQLEADVRGRGLIYGLDVPHRGFCENLAKAAFDRNVIIELAGAEDNVLKFLPSLIIEEELLREGLDIIEECVEEVLKAEVLIHQTRTSGDVVL